MLVVLLKLSTESHICTYDWLESPKLTVVDEGDTAEGSTAPVNVLMPTPRLVIWVVETVIGVAMRTFPIA